MSIKRRIATILGVPVAGAILLTVTSCGTLLYPERAGQARGGSVDATVVCLDAIGLLFGVIPGLIAFAVDFHNNTIYLPAGQSSVTPESDTDEMVAISVAPNQLTQQGIEAVIEKETGLKVRLSDPNLQLKELEPGRSIQREFARVAGSGLVPR